MILSTFNDHKYFEVRVVWEMINLHTIKQTELNETKSWWELHIIDCQKIQQSVVDHTNFSFSSIMF
jgi:hypothetical protein